MPAPADPAGTIVFLLAAGTGSRLAPLTDHVPKPMVPLGGVPILERNVRTLAAAGYREFVVNLHHLPLMVIEHFGDGSPWGVQIDWSPEVGLLGTAGALMAREGRLRTGTFVVVYGDNLLECDMLAPLAAHADSGATVTVATIERPDPGASGVVEADGAGRVTRFVEKPGDSITGPAPVSAGVLVCEPRLLDFVPVVPSDIGRDVLPAMVAAGELVRAIPLVGGIRWIDTPADLEAAERVVV